MKNGENTKLAKSLGFGEKKIKSVLIKQFQNYNHDFTTFYDFVQALLDEPDTGSELRVSKWITVAEAKKKLKEEEGKCRRCLKEERCVLFLPCGHLSCCVACSKTVRKCIVCKSEIEEKIKTYKA